MGTNTSACCTLKALSAARLLQLSVFFLTPSRAVTHTHTHKSLITQNTVLTFSYTGAAGCAALGSAELLESAGLSGRAACWEPNERVHERRTELCGDDAS